MIKHISSPTVISAASSKPKLIQEIFGRVNTNTSQVSIAHMKSPEGWVEPGQTPEFDEYTYVLKGTLHVKQQQGTTIINAGEGVHTPKGEWIQYSTPNAGGAEYIAVCVPAFSPETVHRDK